ncbi:MAG TPA: C2 family cysteine protease, partial [Myxococcota bacterium]|nr:C2 family cysteine protease [Myxococcota bacterium]
MQSYQQSKQSPAVSQERVPQTSPSLQAPKNGRSKTGDPATPAQMNGSDTQRSVLGMDDCSGGPERQNPTAVSLERDVQIVASIQKPVKLAGSARPAESELFTEREASDQSESGWDYVNTQVGSIEEPFALHEPDPTRMFLDGGPRPDDIQQGQLGDCYFLAALTGIVGKDPSLIEKRMRLGSGTVTVELFRYDSSKADWVLEPITVADSLLHEKTSDGGTGSLLSAQPVAGQDPTQGSWYADVTDTELSINADFLYPTARWVALLEKAYAQYVEKYGQYGGATGTGSHENKTTDDQGNALSGYEIMNGGVEEFVYALFYG